MSPWLCVIVLLFLHERDISSYMVDLAVTVLPDSKNHAIKLHLRFAEVCAVPTVAVGPVLPPPIVALPLGYLIVNKST